MVHPASARKRPGSGIRVGKTLVEANLAIVVSIAEEYPHANINLLDLVITNATDGSLRRDAVRQRVFGTVAQALVPAAPGLFPAPAH
ncbi:MAG TPA: hypothetical protein VK789_14170 [Bryobacteraceae bacterium]|nr:hypothetical protein [Bryobacteraceae bacterium]